MGAIFEIWFKEELRQGLKKRGGMGNYGKFDKQNKEMRDKKKMKKQKLGIKLFLIILLQ